MKSFEVCRKRTPEEEKAVAEAKAKRACGCWRGEGPYTYAACLGQYYGTCDVTHEMWRKK